MVLTEGSLGSAEASSRLADRQVSAHRKPRLPALEGHPPPLRPTTARKLGKRRDSSKDKRAEEA